MAISESTKMILIVVLSIVAVISGIVLLWSLSQLKSVINDVPIPGAGSNIRVEVIPQDSQTGTLFFIKANYFDEREQQDLILDVKQGDYIDSVFLFDDGAHFDGVAMDGVYGGYFDSTGRPLGKYEIRSENIQAPLTSFTVNEPGCEIIQGGYNGGQISFVILPQGYQDYDEFKADAKKIISGKNSLLELEPFSSNIDKFAFFIVNTTRDLQCEIGCRNVSTLVCCNNQLVEEEASRCDYDNILVLINSDKECGSASYYAKLCAKEYSAGLVLAHEVGHSFADLADEYVYADYFGDYSIGEINNVNCAQEGCGKWQGVSEGCYEGCTYPNLYRPAEKNSIMYDLYPEFNEVCKDYIQGIIDKYDQDKNKENAMPPEKSYFVGLRYKEENISVKNVFLKPIRSWQDFRKSDYSIEVMNKQGKVFNSTLYVPNKLFPIPPNGTIVYENETDFAVTLPYFEDAEELVIYKADKPVASSKVDALSDKCGDGACEGAENSDNCQDDCDIDEDGFCSTNECDPDCPSQENCNKSKKTLFVSFAIFAVSILFLMVFIMMRMMSRSYE